MGGITDHPNPTAADASRFLSQATFGPTAAEIARLQQIGYGAWLDEQFAAPARGAHASGLAAVRRAGRKPTPIDVINSFWKEAITGQDQLRQRSAFALSQIFVVSLLSSLDGYPDSVAGYLDMLGARSFGTYRELLEAVSRHPMMGRYLSHLANAKEDPERNRVPDQNFAREVMQLFSIGLYELQPDGSPRLVDGGPIETYGIEDVVGLSRVFTGFSWAGPDTSDARFRTAPPPSSIRSQLPMRAYPQFHSVEPKQFLGVTIPAGNTDADADLALALDTLAGHANVGPFLGRQLVQRLVTSNPSPAYVARVTAAFDSGRFTSGTWSTGSGSRGDLRAVIAAVLLDPEARDAPDPTDDRAGRVREPVLRLANWMRAFNARSASGAFRVGRTDNGANPLGQSPLCSPSVFNFYRPGFSPPNSRIASEGLVAPELQITHEASVITYANFMHATVRFGVGINLDVKPDYRTELAMAHDPGALIERIDLLLTGGRMSATTRTVITGAVAAIPLPLTDQATARRNRVCTAVLFALSAPDYLVQR